jgi:hypothetical protein
MYNQLKRKNIIIIDEDNETNNKLNQNNNTNYKISENIGIKDESDELWVKVNGFDKYEVSNKGNVRNIKTHKVLHVFNYFVSMRNNYNNVCNKKVSHVVAENFIDNPNKYTKVEHIDMDKSNNKFTNLRWVRQLKNLNKQQNECQNEQWKLITANTNYEISDKGNVRNTHTKELIKIRITSEGYCSVSLSSGDKKNHFIHRLMATEFIPNPENKISVDHIDKNRANNSLDNLRWATAKEQSENRNYARKKSQGKKVWRIGANDKQLYDNIEDAINFIVENNLTKSEHRKTIFTALRKQLLDRKIKGKTINTCYGYKWEYEEPANLENEEWKNIKDIYPDAHDYKISNFGRVKNTLGDILSGYIGAGGYLLIFLGIGNKKHLIHRLVAELFIPNPENKRCVNHKDGNKTNNCVDNLEWNTHSENVQHAMDTNLNGCSKQIKVINVDTKEETIYINQTDIYKKLNIRTSTISKYIRNKTIYKNMLFSVVDN